MMHAADSSKYYVFYDSECGFCNYWVQWILDHDKKDQFLFAGLQNDFGQQFLRERSLNRKDFSTLYLWKPESFYLVKSQAVSQIASLLGGRWGLLANLNFLPPALGDVIYDRVAANRKKYASKCRVLTPEEQKKFVS